MIRLHHHARNAPPASRAFIRLRSPHLSRTARVRYSTTTTGTAGGRSKGVLRLDEPLDERALFEDTMIRCMRDTQRVQRERRLVFSPEALALAAVEARGARFVRRFEKIAEGQCNRVFLLTLDSDEEVVARLSIGSTYPAHLTNASEAATLTLLREALQLPVPEVYAYSGRRTVNAVGAEYMLAERVGGVELVRRMGALRERPDGLVRELVGIRRRLAGLRFAAFGAVYFREDVDEALRARPLLQRGGGGGAGGEGLGLGFGSGEWEERFRVGPSLHRVFWQGERRTMKIDRGPWPDVPSLARALALAELAHIRTHAVAPPRASPHWRSGDQSDPLAHIRALKMYLALVPFLAPPEGEASARCLLHPDFHAGNLFVSEEGELRVEGIIDWQGAGVGPLYQQMKTPDFLCARPLGAAGHTSRSLADSYRAQLAALPGPLPTALKYNSTLWTALLAAPLEVWPANLALLRYVLLTVAECWGEVFAHTGVRCPIAFTAEERREIARQWEERLGVEAVEDRAVDAVGVELEGWVKVARWEEARARNERALCGEVERAGAEGEEVRRVWPFREHE